MMSFTGKRLPFLLLLAGLALRAVVPDGYMPATAGSGLLFELCPDRLPAGIEFSASADHAHHHQHSSHNSDDASNTAADQCQVGHLLLSATAADQAATLAADAESRSFDVAPGSLLRASNRRVQYQSRAPPA